MHLNYTFMGGVVGAGSFETKASSTAKLLLELGLSLAIDMKIKMEMKTDGRNIV